MRLVAEYKDIKGNAKNIKQVANLRAKQTHFLKALEVEYSDEIIDLDLKHSKYKMSLRGILMGIKTWGDNPVNLFHAVSNSWKGNRVAFAFIPSHSN